MIKWILIVFLAFVNVSHSKETKINYYQDLSIIGYWTSLGIIEGHKWRHTGLDDNLFVFDESYHFYRLLNNMFVVSIPFTVNYKSINYKEILISNLIGWVLYERLQSYVERNDIAFQKPVFKISKINIPRPNPLLETIIATQVGLTLYYTF